MKFSPGVSAVTLVGGRQHTLQWFIHDPLAMFAKGDELEIPYQWINSALAGLERVNPFISRLKNLNVFNDEDNIVLHTSEGTSCLQYSDDVPSSEIVAVISLAPASLPTRRKLMHPFFWICSLPLLNRFIIYFYFHMAPWDGLQTASMQLARNLVRHTGTERGSS
ncbi:hypothetical protein B0H14DRAFT_3044173 [Mycena olivaceomarginata]|nr:hypothetical protein B0H14DRAFT_3044173 [Mycena olivaceomarginata]